MDVFEAVRTVRAIREFKPDPVPPEVVRRIVEAAHLSASASNAQPWHFVLVDDRDELRSIAPYTPTGPYVAQAPLAVVVVLEDSKFAVSDASRAIQSMVLTAWANGVGSNWVGFHDLDGVKPVLNIPKELDVLAVIPFGYPVNASAQGKKVRKPIGEVVHRGKFGQPFE